MKVHRISSPLLRMPLLLACLVSGHVAAADAAAETDADRTSLLELLEEQTAIATKTRLNADYVPGIVTVLRGDELEERGVRTVWEALATVPGIALAIDASGRHQLVVRGIGDTYNSGNVKILLNDVSVNATRDGLANPAMNLPIEQIERIEVIRGPGSAVHGEYAYAGVVNIISRREGQRVYGITGSDGTLGAGAQFQHTVHANGLHMDLNLAGWKTDGAVKDSGTDLLYNTAAGDSAYSYAPGSSNEAGQAGSAIFNLGYRNFSLLAQWSEDGHGDHFGINQVLPPPDSRIVLRNSSKTVKANQRVTASSDWQLDLSLGWRETEQRRDDQFLFPAEIYGGSSTDPDVVLDSTYVEEEWRGAADLYWSGNEHHRLWFGVAHSELRVNESWTEINLDPSTYLPSTQMYRWPIGVTEGQKRRIISLTAQDEWRYSEAFTLTAGLRFDDYSDAGDSLAPRLAGVWRFSDRHVLKAQYARAFRPPNLVELQLSEGEIRPATIDTYELGYIYKDEGRQSRITAFYSELADLIVFDGTTNEYYNADSARSNGIELEQLYQLNAQISLDGNLAWVDTRDSRSGQTIAGTPDWLANLGIRARLTSDTTVELTYRYVGERQREPLDPRQPLAADDETDLTLSMHNLVATGLTLRAGIKNLFDQEIRYPAMLSSGVTPTPVISYAEDYPRPGRTWWLQVSYRY